MKIESYTRLFNEKIVVFLCLLFLCVTVNAQENNGKVVFDWNNTPKTHFKLDLNRDLLTKIMENPEVEITPLFSALDNLYLHQYSRKIINYRQMFQYYHDQLTTRRWNYLNKEDRLHLYTFRNQDFIIGAFVIVKKAKSVYLINMTGKIPPKHVGDLFRNLHQLGIEIPELDNLGELPDSVIKSPKPPTKTTGPSQNASSKKAITPKRPTAQNSELKPSVSDSSESTIISSWKFRGKKIDSFILQNTEGTEGTVVLAFLKNGSGNLEESLPEFIRSLRPHRKITLRIVEEKGKNIAVFTVENRSKSKSLSMVKSLTITRSGVKQRKKVSSARYETDELFPDIATRFRAGEAPIHEIRIQGNQEVSEQRIRQTLQNGSPNIEQALQTLFKVLPYFREIQLHVNEVRFTRVATITVKEKRLSSNAYLGLRPPLFLSFNRVTNWEIGTGFQLGKPNEIGPIWRWYVQEELSTHTSNLFGKISYTFGNPNLHYRFGGRANWGQPYIWHLGFTGQIHRETRVVAPELFPVYNKAATIFQHILGYPDLQNYYLRQGGEVGIHWSPILQFHSFKLRTVAEEHKSLKKSTDWRVLKWMIKGLEARENPSITPGQMRSITFQYDFSTRTDLILNTRTESLGWHHTLLVEHSNTAFGSDFDFTRFQLHLRYAFPLGIDNNIIRTRLSFGYANASLPIQRQFAISGLGGLRGYPLYASDNNSSDSSSYEKSQYAFMGDNGFLLNVEFYFRLANMIDWEIFDNVFLVFFIDEGQVWNVSDADFSFDPKADIGIGLQLGKRGRFRINIAKTLDSWQGYQTTYAWYHSF